MALSADKGTPFQINVDDCHASASFTKSIAAKRGDHKVKDMDLYSDALLP
jgi:hypothetical protein